MNAKEFLENKGVYPNYDLVNYLNEYANIEVMIELENIKQDIKTLDKANASPLCCDDIDDLIRQLRILQLKIINK